MSSCPFCCSEIPSEAVKCPQCAEWLDGRQQRRRGTVEAVALAIAAVVIAVVLINYFENQRREEARDHLDCIIETDAEDC